jgi:methionyl aminopeptidase
VVHGFPDDVPLKEGDSVSLDFGLIYQGYYSDTAVTKAVGVVKPEVQRLIEATSLALEEAIKQAVPGNRIGDIGSRVQTIAKQAGAGLVYEFVGHGIGRKLHERPAIPNFGHAGRGALLKPGMAICIEPMLTLGRGDTTTLDDGWTAVTKDRSIAAHFEHTILITPKGPEVLTRLAA